MAIGVLAALSCTVALGAASVTITSPATGSDVVGTSTDVSGTFSGSANTTVLVSNGTSTVLATLTGANTYTASAVPMAAGANTLTATAIDRDGTSGSASASVNSVVGYVVMTSPTNGATYDNPASLTMQASAMTVPESVQRVDYSWYNGYGWVYIGSATTPPYTYVWNNPLVSQYWVSATVVDSKSRSFRSNNVTVTVLGPDVPPTVSLTSPASGTNFTAPATISLQANATSNGTNVATVDFLQNGQVVASTNVAPYTAILNNVAVGSYSFVARATDVRGGSSTSAPANVTVTVPNVPPTVSLTNPQANTSVLAPANIALAATAADSDGTVAKVDFYANSNLVGTATAAPYTVNWSVTAAGTYTVTATATDNLGASTLSAPVTVTVTDGITYLHTDVNGTPIAATDSSGAVIWKESFQPYGTRLNNQAAASGNRQWFHGKESDADTGLSYFGARYYDPTLGRFMGVDPAGFQEKNLQSFNRYAYGNNNPYRFVDPDGKDAVEAIDRWWNASVAGFKSEGPVDAVMRAIQALPVDGAVVGAAGAIRGLGAEAKLAKGVEGVAARAATTGSENAANGLRLSKQLASEAQMAETGTTLAGVGAKKAFRGAQKIAEEFGGNAADWAKKGSSSFTAKDGVKFETHWVENLVTGERVEFKTKFPGE